MIQMFTHIVYLFCGKRHLSTPDSLLRHPAAWQQRVWHQGVTEVCPRLLEPDLCLHPAPVLVQPLHRVQHHVGVQPRPAHRHHRVAQPHHRVPEPPVRTRTLHVIGSLSTCGPCRGPGSRCWWPRCTPPSWPEPRCSHSGSLLVTCDVCGDTCDSATCLPVTMTCPPSAVR